MRCSGVWSLNDSRYFKAGNTSSVTTQMLRSVCHQESPVRIRTSVDMHQPTSRESRKVRMFGWRRVLSLLTEALATSSRSSRPGFSSCRKMDTISPLPCATQSGHVYLQLESTHPLLPLVMRPDRMVVLVRNDFPHIVGKVPGGVSPPEPHGEAESESERREDGSGKTTTHHSLRMII